MFCAFGSGTPGLRLAVSTRFISRFRVLIPAFRAGLRADAEGWARFPLLSLVRPGYHDALSMS